MQTELTFPQSLWAATAKPLELNRLEDDIQTEVLVIGGGFTGLSAAIRLRELGLDVVLVDAVDVGFGASGRNGGQVIPGLKFYPEEIRARYGTSRGNQIISATNASADLVFNIIDRYQIDCHASRKGFIQPAFSSASCRVIEKRVEQLAQTGAPVELLDKQTTDEYLGSHIYHSALLDRRGGGLQPLSYVRGLAAAADDLGASCFSHACVKSLRQKEDNWVAETESARISAERVLICTNGYTNLIGENQLWSGLSRSVVPLFSFQIATKPLSETVRESILPYGHVASDTRRLLSYFRLDHLGRLVVGGRGGVNDAATLAHYNHIIKRMTQLFPQIGKPNIDYYWSGKVALTTDGLPHIHELAPGVYTGLGYNGRGVGMATLMGTWLAELAAGNSLENSRLPVTELKPIRFQQWRKPVIKMAYIWKSLQDHVEMRRPI